MEKDVILGIGQYLKKARENKGMTIEEVSEDTKIKIRILESIEQNKFDGLGGSGYSKALIESYAKHLGADDDKLHSLINNRFPSKLSHKAKYDSIQPKRVLIPTNFLAIIILVILVIVLIFTTVKLSQAGLLKSPFKKKQTEQIKEKKEEVKPLKKEADKKNENKQIKIKPKMLQEAASANLEEQKQEEKISLNRRALRDSSDYLKKLMFKGKENPFL